YMVNGVRSSKKTGSKAVLYQPASLLEMDVYHNDQKTMHRIRECSWSFLYKNVLSDVVKNSIAIFMVELLHKTLKQPEQNNDLFYFCEDALQQLDTAPPAVAANFPLFFSLQLMQFVGIRISDWKQPTAADESVLYLDLHEGMFTTEAPTHPYALQTEDALLTSLLLKIMHPAELDQIKMNQQKRRFLLSKFMEYYALHIPDFGKIRTLDILHEVLG
ncbi:MAG: DNA repair protein RecO, partial [Chitinophagaceae bacterium]